MSIEAMKQALEALRNAEVVYMEQLNAMYALQQAIAEAEKQEPEPEKMIPIGGLREAVHVIPINDLREHTASVDCWCKPTEDGEWPDVWVHHSMDQREEYEKEKNHEH